jgi:hypothetical protein
MSYSVSIITTIADCDALLAMAAEEQANLLHRKQNLDFSKNNSSKTAVEIEAELAIVNAELANLAIIIPTMPEGSKNQRDYLEKQSKFQWRLKQLNNKKIDHGVLDLLEKELDNARTDKEIAELADFVAAITARKAAL